MIEQSPTVRPYFDGDTPDTGSEIYAWTGTANGSTSTQSLQPDRSSSRVKATVYPRDWLVI
jgi:hypothetical protein